MVVGEYMASITTTPNTVWKTFGAYPGADDLMNCRPKVTSVIFEGEHR